MTATLSVAAILAESARRRPDQIALVQDDHRLTYTQLWELARRYGQALLERGIAPGSRVALMAPNTIGFVAGYYGALAIGATVVPVPAMLQPREMSFLLQHSGAHIVLADPTLLAQATRAGELTGGVAVLDLNSLAEGVAPISTYRPCKPEDVAVIFYTSGTTGLPKGARLTHLNLVMNATCAAFDCFDFTAEDTMFGCLPLFHVFGQSCAMTATFRVGGRLVLQPRFEPTSALQTLLREQVTIMLGVPTMFVYLNRVAENLQGPPTEPAPKPITPQLRFAVSGGAAMPMAVSARFEELFGAPVYEGYGLSETSPVASANQPSLGVHPGTIGHPLWGVELAIADPTQGDRTVLLPDGEPGEIVIRGHNVFDGYLNDPEATSAAFADGWFRTGDIGTRHPDGYITVVDRTKDLIIRGGYNIYPREVEELLITHPAVQQVAVIGLPDPAVGEEVCAVVTPTPGVDIDPETLITWARERLAHHKCPRRIEIIDQMPLGPSQKILKRQLRAQLA
ncbi:long-chain-fatty-acid--CoA ligase [Austwickia chelonae]|uniref:long-chain-fatty-acid--CoA ligase n=1 Tax=Austwickia chelonae TaxID=100225 RepID=UPI000E23B3E5|nr:long-chain fatty acid--CoA ligase [Austwickia chelonae]